MFTCSNITSNPRRPKKSRPLRPTRPSAHFSALLPNVMKTPAPLMMFVLKLPHSPLSAVTMMTSVLLCGPRSRAINSGCTDESTRAATLASTRCICAAYGRAFMMRSVARRSFDAATIFMALRDLRCVFFTARTRAGGDQ